MKNIAMGYYLYEPSGWRRFFSWSWLRRVWPAGRRGPVAAVAAELDGNGLRVQTYLDFLRDNGPDPRPAAPDRLLGFEPGPDVNRLTAA